MSHKARTLMSKLRRQSRVRPYRERAEITPLLATSNGHKANGNKSNGLTTVVEIENRLYPLLEETEGKFCVEIKCVIASELSCALCSFSANYG